MHPIAEISLRGACYTIDGLNNWSLSYENHDSAILFAASDNYIIAMEWGDSRLNEKVDKIQSQIIKIRGNLCVTDGTKTPFETSITALSCSWGSMKSCHKKQNIVYVAVVQLLHSVAIYSYDRTTKILNLLGIDYGKGYLSTSIVLSFNYIFVETSEEYHDSLTVSLIDQVSRAQKVLRNLT